MRKEGEEDASTGSMVRHAEDSRFLGTKGREPGISTDQHEGADNLTQGRLGEGHLCGPRC